MSTTPGWYYAQGDAPGTTRYWDGTQWIGDPVPTPGQAAVGPARDDLAKPGQRIGARVIDIIIFLIILVAFFLPAITDLFDGLEALPDDPTEEQVRDVFEDAFDGRGLSTTMSGIVAFAWEWLFVAFLGGTPGKLILGIRITDRDTGKMPVGLGQAALRSLNRLAPLLAAVSLSASNAVTGILGLVGLASFIMLFADDQRRTVMDHIGRTLVRVK